MMRLLMPAPLITVKAVPIPGFVDAAWRIIFWTGMPILVILSADRFCAILRIVLLAIRIQFARSVTVVIFWTGKADAYQKKLHPR